METVRVLVLSDSIGETGETVVNALMKQFPEKNYVIERHSYIKELSQVDAILDTIEEGDVIISTLIIDELRNYLIGVGTEKGLNVFDILGGPLQHLEKIFGIASAQEAGSLRDLDEDYFNTIEAMEFTIKYDDGKNPMAILKADIVLIGVSRTSKTPTSMYLATQGYKVCNIPLVPEIDIPKELYQVDPKRVVALLINPEKLHKIREERLKEMGLVNVNTEYSQYSRIQEEIDYALEVIEKIGCRVIDVTNSTIQGTASKIVDIYRENFSSSL